MVLYKVCVLYADRKSKMAVTTAGHSINTGPYGENTEIYSSLKLLHWLNLNCASIIGRSFTNFFFYVDRNSKMTTTAGHSFYIGQIGSFYNQVNDAGSWEPLAHLAMLKIINNLADKNIGHEEDFNFILFNHFQSKCPLGTGPWWPLYMNGIALELVPYCRFHFAESHIADFC
jgi:hypothetical protein